VNASFTLIMQRPRSRHPLRSALAAALERTVSQLGLSSPPVVRPSWSLWRGARQVRAARACAVLPSAPDYMPALRWRPNGGNFPQDCAGLPRRPTTNRTTDLVACPCGSLRIEVGTAKPRACLPSLPNKGASQNTARATKEGRQRNQGYRSSRNTRSVPSVHWAIATRRPDTGSLLAVQANLALLGRGFNRAAWNCPPAPCQLQQSRLCLAMEPKSWQGMSW
jgi:hypothetical protein